MEQPDPVGVLTCWRAGIFPLEARRYRSRVGVNPFYFDLLADATEVTVPAEFEDLFDVFGPDVVSEYKVEVIAIEESGNKTITEESLIEEEE